MKTKVIAFSFAIALACMANILTANHAQANNNHVEMTGAGDGHCSKCGLNSNGHYRCPSFCPASGAQPTTCKCGHSKVSHAYL